MSSAMLFSGLMPTKLLRFMTFMNLNSIKLSTFMVHQASYLQPSIYQLWEKKQRSYFEKGVQRGSPICVAGDGRCDSMGHCAKYCTYTIMDVEEGIIIDIQLVQSNEVKSSVHMEKEGLSRCIETLKSKGLTVCNIITDRHVQVKMWVKDNMPETKHSVDVWHVAKGLKKKLMKLSKEKDCSDITPWIKSITNHMYWVSSSTPDACKELMWEKWSSLGNHIQDVHFGHELVFKNCCHAGLTERSKKKKWLKSATG